MQLLSWLYSKQSLKLASLVVVLGMSITSVIAQSKIIDYEVVKKETLYKISILYSTEVDSLVKWNDLSSDLISEGQVIRVLDYYDLQKEELALNNLTYAIVARETKSIEQVEFYNDKIDSLQAEKDNVDQSSPFAMQSFFDLAKKKKLYVDSISLAETKAEEDIERLEQERLVAKTLVLKKYKKKYNLEGELTLQELPSNAQDELIDVVKENERLAEVAYVKQKEADFKESMVLDAKLKAATEAAKKKKQEEDQAAGKAKKQLEKEAKALADLQKANKLAAKKQLKEANKEEEKFLKQAAEKDKVKSAELEVEKAATLEKLKNELEIQKLEQDKLEKQKKEEQKKLEEEEVEKENELKKDMTPMEKELGAMAAAKKAAMEKKAKKEEEEKNKQAKKQEEKEKSKAVKNIKEDNEDDVLVFDVQFEAEKDTSSKKYKKQQLALAKELDEIESQEEGEMRTVKVDEVLIQSSKKSKKLKMGDEVDVVRMEKSRFYLSRAMFEIDKNNYKKAIEYADKSIVLNPNYTEAYMLKGDVMASFAYYDKAYNSYQKANMIDNRIPQLHYNMGNCLIYLGETEMAIVEMGKAISIDSSYILAYSGRSALFIEMNKYRSALYDYNTILSFNKYFYPALKGRGLANLNLGSYDDAIRDFNELLEYDTNDPSVYYHRGMAKMYKSEIYGACMDFLSSSERGYVEAIKAINKYCD